jgi:hypothetical protein
LGRFAKAFWEGVLRSYFKSDGCIPVRYRGMGLARVKMEYRRRHKVRSTPMKNIPFLSGFIMLLMSAILLLTVNTNAVYVDAFVLIIAICIYVGTWKRP